MGLLARVRVRAALVCCWAGAAGALLVVAVRNESARAVARSKSVADAVTQPIVDRVKIPHGPATLGSNQGDDDERPQRTEVVQAFSIDRTEVTWRAYAVCVKAGRCPALGPVNSNGEVADARWHNLPVTGINWGEASAYCRFARGRLPTEREWEKAARGTDGRIYPWGNDADCARANWGNFEGEGPCAGRSPGHPVTVGGYPDGASPYGVLDLAGNVWEWIADSYSDDQGRRIVKGGSCCSYFVTPRASNRNAWAPEHRDVDLGFRCVGL